MAQAESPYSARGATALPYPALPHDPTHQPVHPAAVAAALYGPTTPGRVSARSEHNHHQQHNQQQHSTQQQPEGVVSSSSADPRVREAAADAALEAEHKLALLRSQFLSTGGTGTTDGGDEAGAHSPGGAGGRGRTPTRRTPRTYQYRADVRSHTHGHGRSRSPRTSAHSAAGVDPNFKLPAYMQPKKPYPPPDMVRCTE